MKKYLLTALLLFGLVSFVSAENYSVVGDGENYSPSSLTTEGGVFNYISTNPSVGQEGVWYIFMIENSENETLCCDELDPGESSFISCYDVPSCDGFNLSSGTYILDNDDTTFSSISFSISSSSEGDSDSSPLLSGGTTVFSGIISSLGSAVSEFIPYVAYIGIGLLGAIIGFVAIKRLINRVRAKIFGTFSGGRRR